MKRLIVAAILFLGLGGCSGISPTGATKDSGLSPDGTPTIASSGETKNTPMPTGNVALLPEPRCGGDGEPPCPEPLRLQAKVALLCKDADTGDTSIQLEGSLTDPAAVAIRHLRILQEDSLAPQYTDVTVKLGEGFSIKLETAQPAALKFYDVQNWHPPLNPAKEKDCPGYDCLKEMGINAVVTELELSEAPALPCMKAADSTAPAVMPQATGFYANRTDDGAKVKLPANQNQNNSEGPAIQLK